MATLLSSPPRPAARFDMFEQPISPTLRHDDLPAEFTDRSFGSSMSLGSSFDLGNGRLPASGSSSNINALATINSSSSLSSSSLGTHSSPSPPRALPALIKRSSPTTSRKLGEAMGTELNGKSPGLAAKLSSPHYMDISPAPEKTNCQLAPSASSSSASASTSSASISVPKGIQTPVGVLQTANVPSSCLPPGSAMKEDTPESSALRANSSQTVSRANSRVSSRAASRASSLASSYSNSPEDATQHAPHGVPGGSLGRLFGTCLSVNTDGQQRTGADSSFGTIMDPDNSFEMPAPKRRPSSLPMGEGRVPVRPSLRSAGLLPSMRKTSGSLMNFFRDDEVVRRRPSQDVARRRMHRSSEPSLGPTAPRSRQGSAEPCDSPLGPQTSHPSMLSSSAAAAVAAASSSSGLAKGLSAARCRERADNMGLSALATHSTIIESPSPATLQKQDLGSYFFDPQSPQTSLQGIINNPAPPTRTLPNRPPFVKAHTQLESSSCKRKVDERRGASSGLGATLGARSLLRPTGMCGKNSEAIISESSAQCALQRQKAPAPRRALSSFDATSMLMLPEPSSRENVRMLDGPSPSPAGGRRFPDGFNADGSPIAPASKRAGFLRRTSKDDSSPLVYNSHRHRACNGSGLSTVDDEEDSIPASTSLGAECMPGFGASERSGKILPCFNVKEDGLMRIVPETLVALLQGKYNSHLESYQVVDCRFGYEYEGGHIPGAVNLSTVERVKNYFLSSATANLPPRSQSGKPDSYGNTRKPILVFHCEFSAKRAPSMALALRQADRALAQDYPDCHYPEIYILQGGYSGFFTSFQSVCEPQAYVRMDDPFYQDQRSSELNGFRKQFSRHRSFTYGESRQAEVTAAASRPFSGFVRDSHMSTMICEESAESSFEHDSSPSNIAAAKRQMREDDGVEAGKAQGVHPSYSLDDTSIDSDAGLPVSSTLASSTRGPADVSPCAQIAHNHQQYLPMRKGSLGPAPTAKSTASISKSAMPPPTSRRPFLRAGTTGGFLHSGRA